MNKYLTSLLRAGILSIVISAPQALAASPCGTMAGKSYAILITGAHYFNGTEPTSPAPVPTPIVGLGTMQISASCTISGELIYNDNDTVTGPGSCSPGGSGVAFGGSYATPTVIDYSGSVPCFTGTNSQLVGNVSVNSASLGSLTVTDTVTGNIFNFSVSDGLGSTSWSGTSVATNTGSGTVPPILTIQGQKQAIVPALVPVPTTYGQAPWRGQWQFTCTSVSTFDNINNPGAFFSETGGFAIPADNSPVGGGIVNENWNNAFLLLQAAAGPDAPCYFNLDLDDSGAGPFSDGTDNVAVPVDGPYSGECTAANVGNATAGSSVVWGTTDSNFWFISTAVTDSAFGGTFVPPGESGGICTSTPAPVGKLSGPASIVTGGTPSHPRTVKLLYSNSSPMDCLTYFTLSGGSGNCVFAATTTDAQTEDITPGFDSNTAVELRCTGSDSGATLTASWGGAFPSIPGGPQCALPTNPITLQ
jgi:hypothetical protein